MSCRKYELNRQEQNIATWTVPTSHFVGTGKSMNKFETPSRRINTFLHSQVNVLPAFNVKLALSRKRAIACQ